MDETSRQSTEVMAPRTVLKEQLMCKQKTDAKKSVNFSDLEKIIDVLINLEDIQKRDTRAFDRSVRTLSYQVTRMSTEVNKALNTVSSKIFELEKSVGLNENAEEHAEADRYEIDVGDMELNEAAAVENYDLSKTKIEVNKVENESQNEVAKDANTVRRNSAQDIPKLRVLTPGWNSYCPVKPFRGDGNTTFASWLRKFQDYIEAGGAEWKDTEKLGKLKLFLDGLPREQFEELTATEKQSFSTATTRLVEIIDSPKTKEIARQNLSRCIQGDKESINDFAERLVPLVRAATAGQGDAAYKEKLLECFLDKLAPHIRFFVKVSSDCTSFEQARLKAQEVEGLPGAATLGAMMQSREDESRSRALKSLVTEKNDSQMNQNGRFNTWKPRSEGNFTRGISRRDNSPRTGPSQRARFGPTSRISSHYICLCVPFNVPEISIVNSSVKFIFI
ncbi:CBR-DCT-10 protein [Ditylenchus destructor]|nr:CBR-DCT-10 protein [Ditylenchus destructor]